MENQESKMRSKRLTICQIRIVDYRTYVCLAIQWRHEFELREGYSILLQPAERKKVLDLEGFSDGEWRTTLTKFPERR